MRELLITIKLRGKKLARIAVAVGESGFAVLHYRDLEDLLMKLEDLLRDQGLEVQVNPSLMQYLEDKHY